MSSGEALEGGMREYEAVIEGLRVALEADSHISIGGGTAVNCPD